MLDLKEDARWDFAFAKYPQAISTAVKASVSILDPVYEPIEVQVRYRYHNGVHILSTNDLEPYASICVQAQTKGEGIYHFKSALVRALVYLTKDTYKLPAAVFEGLEIKLIYTNDLYEL